MVTLSEVVSVLESFRGREKVMRTIQYGALLMTPFMSKKISDKMEVLSEQLGLARIILRLFDDLPMLQYTISYGLGRQEEDYIQRFLQLSNNLIDQLYFPVEHFAWARNTKILSGKAAPVWRFCILLWVISLILSIIRSLQNIRRLERVRISTMEQRDAIESKVKEENLLIIMHSADLINGMHWLNFSPFTLTFKNWQVGLLGVISSLIGLRNLLLSR